VKSGYEKRRETYKIEADDTQEIKDLKGKIMNLVNEAYQKLIDREYRRSYRKKVISDYQVHSGADLLISNAEAELFIRNDINLSFDLYESIYDMLPDRPELKAGYGYLLMKRYKGIDKDKYVYGKKLLDEAITQAPNSQKVRLFKGKRYVLEGQMNMAINEFTAILNANPSNAFAKLELGRIKGKEG